MFAGILITLADAFGSTGLSLTGWMDSSPENISEPDIVVGSYPGAAYIIGQDDESIILEERLYCVEQVSMQYRFLIYEEMMISMLYENYVIEY